jgi:hypothetical protein
MWHGIFRFSSATLVEKKRRRCLKKTMAVNEVVTSLKNGSLQLPIVNGGTMPKVGGYIGLTSNFLLSS